VIYQDPRAYLIGLEGLALLRAFAGDHDRDFTCARFDEIRTLLDSRELGEGVEVDAVPIAEAYDGWAEYYDEPGNAMVEVEQPVVWELLAGLPPGAALDAACGTGRHSAQLAKLGHDVVGVDASPRMIARARAKVPDGSFHVGDLHELPLPDGHVDLVVCGLAMMHVPNLEPVLEEFVRVLKPGGHLVISDWRGLTDTFVIPVLKTGADGTAGYLPAWRRSLGAYLRAALPLGLDVRRCEEPLRPWPIVRPDEPQPEQIAGAPPNVWALMPKIPDAANAAYAGTAIVVVWHFCLGRGNEA
jgi:ubiquinone/menaquinone biosynthesis C-methylase UbiE